jgi:gas vesicle protein
MSKEETAGGSGSGGPLVFAFIAGAVTGAAVALLFAPAAGEDTRQFLTDKARESRDRATEAARQGRDFLNRQRETLRSAVERGREAYQQAREPRDTGEPA